MDTDHERPRSSLDIPQGVIPGAEPLVPPTPNVARAYLDEVTAVGARRERRVDRRAVGWLTIASSMLSGVLISGMLLALDVGFFFGSQSLVMCVLLLNPIISGMNAWRGFRTLLSDRWPERIAVIGFAAVVLASFLLVMVTPVELPLWVQLVPGALLAIGGGGFGIVMLRDSVASDRPIPAPMSPAARWRTCGIGILLGALAALLAHPEGILSAVVILVGYVVVVILLTADFIGAGLAAAAESWRLPHLIAIAAAMIALCALVMIRSVTGDLASPIAAGTGAAIVLVFAGVALSGARRD